MSTLFSIGKSERPVDREALFVPSENGERMAAGQSIVNLDRSPVLLGVWRRGLDYSCGPGAVPAYEWARIELAPGYEIEAHATILVVISRPHGNRKGPPPAVAIRGGEDA